MKKYILALVALLAIFAVAATAVSALPPSSCIGGGGGSVIYHEWHWIENMGSDLNAFHCADICWDSWECYGVGGCSGGLCSCACGSHQ